MSKNKIFVVFSAIGLFVILMFAALLVVKPPQITKLVLESKEFQNILIKKIKNISGLNLSFASLKSDEDLNVTMTLITVKGDSDKAPLCHIPKIQLKLKNSWRLADVEFLEIIKPKCSININTDGELMGLKYEYTPSLSDFGLLFGISLKKIKISELAVQGHRLNNTFEAIQQFNIDNLTTLFDAQISLTGQKLFGQILLSESPLEFMFTDVNGVITTVKLAAEGELNLDSMFGHSTQVKLKILEQNFLPYLNSRDYPITIDTALEWSQLNNINAEKLSISMHNIFEFSSKGEIQFSPTYEQLDAKFENVEFRTSSHIKTLLDIQNNKHQILEFANASAKLTLDATQKDYNLNLKITIPPISSSLPYENNVQIDNSYFDIAVNTDSTKNNVPFKIHSVLNKLLSLRNNIYMEKVEIASSGIVDGYNVNFDQFDFKVNENHSVGSMGGQIEFDLKETKINVHAQVAQKLETFDFEDAEIKGEVITKVDVMTDENNGYNINGGLSANIDNLKYKNILIQNANFSSPIKARIANGISTVVMKGVFSQLLEEYFTTFDQVDLRFQGEIENLTFYQDATVNSPFINLSNMKMGLDYLHRIETLPTSLDGTFVIDKFKSSEQTHNNRLSLPMEGKWSFTGAEGSPVRFEAKSSLHPIVDLTGSVYRKENEHKLEYNIKGDLDSLLKKINGNSADGLASILIKRGVVDIQKDLAVIPVP